MLNFIFSPLKRRSDEIVLLGIACFLFIVATNTQTGWLFLVDAILVGTLLLGFISSRLQIRGLKVERTFRDRVYEGENLKVEILLQNTHRWQKHLITVEEKFPASEKNESKTFLLEKIEGNKTRTISYEEECFKRGIYSFPPLKLEAGAPLGFFPFGKTLKKDGELIIFPSGPSIENLPARSTSLYTASQNRPYSTPGQSHDFLGIRDYQPGEGTRYIHWKATAKLGKLMVKEFKKLSSRELTIFIDNSLDIGKGRETSLEYVVKAAASLSNLSVQQNNYFKLITLDTDKIITLANPGHLHCMEWLAGITPTRTKITAETIASLAREANYKTRLILLLSSPWLDPSWLQPLNDKRVSVKIFIFDSDSFEEHEEQALAAKRFDYLEERLKKENTALLRIKKGDNLKKALVEGLSL
ncbi:MAG: DUF58 domain-containing protein [Firmicutes bacterium]|nr:DUF58 domain-containing protein [Bacillota bacterium]